MFIKYSVSPDHMTVVSKDSMPEWAKKKDKETEAEEEKDLALEDKSKEDTREK